MTEDFEISCYIRGWSERLPLFTQDGGFPYELVPVRGSGFRTRDGVDVVPFTALGFPG